METSDPKGCADLFREQPDEAVTASNAATSTSRADALELLTYTKESDFQSCRKLFQWKHERGIELVGEDSEPLYWGGLWHSMAEIRDRLRMAGVARADAVAWSLAWLSDRTQGRGLDQRKRIAWLVLSTAMRHYEARFAEGAVPPRATDDEVRAAVDGRLADAFLWVGDSDLELLECEHAIKTPLVNPETGARSRSFRNGLKIDALVRRRSDGKPWLFEKKMLSDIGDVNRLWTDFQLTRYARQVWKDRGERLEGAIYDVVLRPRIRPKEAYTEPLEEWQSRLDAKLMEARTKLRERLTTRKKDPHEPTQDEYVAEDGRVRQLKSMQRDVREAETDAEFVARLDEFFAKPMSMVRVPILFDDDLVRESEEITWETSQQILDARRRGKWRKNLAHCYHRFGGVCPMIPLCRDGLDPEKDETVATMYRERKSANPEFDEDPLLWVRERLEGGAVPDAILASINEGEAKGSTFLDGFADDVRSLLRGDDEPVTGKHDVEF